MFKYFIVGLMACSLSGCGKASRYTDTKKEEQTMKPFDIPVNTAVISSSYIFTDKMPILLVNHGYDEEMGEDWQFHAGNGDFDMSKMMLVSLQNIMDYDATINEVSDLPIGFYATRKSVGGPWIYAEQQK